MGQIVKAPEIVESIPGKVNIFLAGSIEMGVAEDWQTKVGNEIKDDPYTGLVFNPRRDSWDSSWKQSIDNPQFKEQVDWELDHINAAKIVFFYFDPKTTSPITLAELGLTLGRNEGIQARQVVIVCCPDGFYRQGNVEIMCKHAGFSIIRDLHTATNLLKSAISIMGKWGGQ